MIQAPRGTFDILPESAQQRKLVEAEADRILGAAGYRRIETPTFEATELFARGVGEATDIVQKEMYTFDDGGGRSLTLRPEGTAPVCRAYLEHGMRKLAQPVKLWYLGPFFRAEAPQRGRYREFWQVGAEAIGSDAPETDAELIVLLAELLDAVGVKGTRLRLSSLGTPDTRAEYREELQAFLRAHEGELAEEVRNRIDLNPMRAFDSSDAGTRAVMRDAPKLLDRLDPDDAEHFERGPRAARRRRPALRARPDARARHGLLHAHGVRVHQRRARRPVGRRRRRPLRRPDRAARRASDAGVRLGRRSRADAAGRARGSRRRPSSSTCSWRSPSATRPRGAAFELALATRGAPGLQAQLELAGRSLKGQLRHADRIGARYVAIIGDNGIATLKNMESGEQHDTGVGDVIPEILRGGRLP